MKSKCKIQKDTIYANGFEKSPRYKGIHVKFTHSSLKWKFEMKIKIFMAKIEVN